MPNKSKRATIYFDPDLHRALRLKSAETEYSMSELVNEAVRLVLAEDEEDLAALEERMNEPTIPFEKLQDMIAAQTFRELLKEVFLETFEEIALAEAIREGQQSP